MAKKKTAKKKRAPKKRAPSRRRSKGREAAKEARTRGSGRPSKLTVAVRDKVVQAVRVGNYPEIAARYAGIGKSTYYRWMKAGAIEEGKPVTQRTEVWEFWDAVTRAEAESEVAAVSVLVGHAQRDGRSVVEFLRRRYRERWGVEILEQRKPGESEKVGLDAVRELLTEEEREAMDTELEEASEE